MDVLLSFLLAFFFSFVGSIPPGTLNLTIIQLGLENRVDVAWRFAFAAALVEYPYAWLAVKFEALISSSPVITNNIELIASIVMILLGVFNLWSPKKRSGVVEGFDKSGFKRGIVLGMLNPLALPFWVAITTYLKGLQWIDLSSHLEIHSYLFGVSLGAFILLIVLAALAKRIATRFKDNPIIKKMPGIMLLALGFYALFEYVLNTFGFQ
ncbi:LysE family translocator [Chryseosolibacter indicus]|uniref:LysE family transporter n=1 Tax=Chryseosolibacter indicus TaxID=2782351 RepID=A0ABS5VX76_9BACT|nr:LysE family transporter [Chryseosolibacter indicus]MBT1706014.1 LysE family transporter [Chryseosolibacter indicus]